MAPVLSRREWNKKPGLFDVKDTANEEAWLLVMGDGTRKNRGCVNTCYQFARKLARSESDVDDLVQDGLLAAHAAARRFFPLMGTKFITIAHTWAKHAIKASWDSHHRHGLKGQIDNDAVPSLFTASDPDGGEDLFVRVTGDAEDDVLESVALDHWWESLPTDPMSADPEWAREMARLKYSEGLSDKAIRKHFRWSFAKHDYHAAILLRLVADLFDVDTQGRRPEDQCGKYAKDGSEKWERRLGKIPADREDLLEVGQFFFRQGVTIREIAKDWATTSDVVKGMVREIVDVWKKGRKENPLEELLQQQGTTGEENQGG
jgi:DNA-directed RNA polymerase specialized sigma24 family protein